MATKGNGAGKIVVELAFFKETPGTYRFDIPEATAEGTPIKSLYVMKRAFKGKSAPKKVKVTVEY